MKVLFVADFFREQLAGGGESNDNNLINFLNSNGVLVVKKNSSDITTSDVSQYEKIIIGNFILLSSAVREALCKAQNYIIYEHDHKYLTTRDPSKYNNFVIPANQRINVQFYERAQRVVVLSRICAQILKNTIPEATIHNIGCSLWSPETLGYISSLRGVTKNHDYCILKSSNPTKNYIKTREFCTSKGIKPLEIHNPDYYEFLRLMSTAKSFIFLPTVLETFSRVCAEAKMLNLEVRTIKNLIGFYSEDYSNLQGSPLTDKILEKNQMAYEYFYNWVTT